MTIYVATFFKRTGGTESEEVGTGKTMPDGLRDAWSKLPKTDQRGVTRAKVSELGEEKIIRYDLRQGKWVRVGPVEANKLVRPLEEDEGD